MAFTVADFQDLLRLLHEHPEWRMQLWAVLAGEELLRLPGEFRAFREETDRRFGELTEAVRQLAEAQRRTEERVARLEAAVTALAEAQRRHYEEFAAYRAETDRRFAELAEAVRRLAMRIEDVAGQLRGRTYEDHYRSYLRRYRRLVAEPRVLSPAEREELLRAAEAAGRITPEEADDLDEADVVVRGREAFLVVEVSATVHPADVERAAARAAALRKALPGVEVLAVVAGPEIHPDAARMARSRAVWWLKDGRAFAPHEIPVESLPR
jgi:vacuolar-type H+-ATPase subunit I/STV1